MHLLASSLPHTPHSTLSVIRNMRGSFLHDHHCFKVLVRDVARARRLVLRNGDVGQVAPVLHIEVQPGDDKGDWWREAKKFSGKQQNVLCCKTPIRREETLPVSSSVALAA
jgi:hypothetical protein